VLQHPSCRKNSGSTVKRLDGPLRRLQVLNCSYSPHYLIATMSKIDNSLNIFESLDRSPKDARSAAHAAARSQKLISLPDPSAWGTSSATSAGSSARCYITIDRLLLPRRPKRSHRTRSRINSRNPVLHYEAQGLTITLPIAELCEKCGSVFDNSENLIKLLDTRVMIAHNLSVKFSKQSPVLDIPFVF
jgi:hypothetical protein